MYNEILPDTFGNACERVLRLRKRDSDSSAPKTKACSRLYSAIGFGAAGGLHVSCHVVFSGTEFLRMRGGVSCEDGEIRRVRG